MHGHGQGDWWGARDGDHGRGHVGLWSASFGGRVGVHGYKAMVVVWMLFLPGLVFESPVWSSVLPPLEGNHEPDQFMYLRIYMQPQTRPV